MLICCGRESEDFGRGAGEDEEPASSSVAAGAAGLEEEDLEEEEEPDSFIAQTRYRKTTRKDSQCIP